MYMGTVMMMLILVVQGVWTTMCCVLKLFEYGEKMNDWDRLVSTTSYLFYWAARLRGDNAGGDQSRELVARDLATTFWLRVAMPDTNKAALEGRLKHLSPMQHPRYPDMLVVVGRAVAGLRHHFQKDFLPILISGTRTAYLIMLWAHCEDHAGVDVSCKLLGLWVGDHLPGE